MKKFMLNSPEDYKLMSQTGVKQYVFPLDCTHNAIWDSYISPDDRLFFALATEISTSGYVRLCEYDYEKNEVKAHFKVEDIILPNDRTIRASKFHTSINFITNDKMIMTTHTTDKSPAHPTWMPEAYYHHLWEGFPGSNIITYDRSTGDARNLGVPVPRESIYGSIYEPEHNCLYFLGFFRGHLYRYSLDDKKVLEMGKVSENYAFRLVMGPDKNIYGASRSGYVFKVNTDKAKIIDMDYRLPHYNYKYPREFNNISVGRIGPDGRLYFAIMYSKSIVALDTKTGKFEDMGAYLPDSENYINGENRNGIFGMDFDSKGMLWYALSSKNDTGNIPETGLPGSLFCWDITKRKAPQWAGLLGTRNRVGVCLTEVCISKEDILYAVGSNHSVDGPDITAIDLKQFVPEMGNMCGIIEDGFYDPKDQRYIESSRILFEQEQIGEANPVVFDKKIAAPPIELWRTLAPDNIQSSGVIGLTWDEENNLHGICGRDRKFAFKIAHIENCMRLESLYEIDRLDAAYRQWLEDTIEPKLSKLEMKGTLPYYPGRQYKAIPHIDVELCGGRRIVATLDGMLAIVSGDSVFSLGPASYNGPVHAMATNAEKTVVYGVAGDQDDIGSVFSYDDKNGLRWRGTISSEVPIICLTKLSCCAMSKDGRFLAIATDERLGTVVIYEL